MSRVQCFLLERTNLAERSYRRYGSGSSCTGRYGYHNASVVINDTEPFGESDYDGYSPLATEEEKLDPKWPKTCSCGYTFKDDDIWQINIIRLYRDPRDQKLYISDKSPSGAMWFVDFPDNWKGPDGHSLAVMLPDGNIWNPDVPSKNGTPWTRTGTPPNVTARPSILTSNYHGFLTDGFLEPC